MRALFRVLTTAAVVLAVAGCAQPIDISAADKRLATQVGERGPAEIKSTGKAGHLVFGPYVALEPGIYRLDVKGSLRGPGRPLATLDVASDKGERIWMVRPIYADATADIIATAAFVIDRRVTDAEFRIFVHDQTVGTFKGFSLKKIE